MGNQFICMLRKDTEKIGSRSKRMSRSQRRLAGEKDWLHRQALSRVLHQHQMSPRFDGSKSRRVGGSTSFRRLTLFDPLSPQNYPSRRAAAKAISGSFKTLPVKFRPLDRRFCFL
ncbi:hypothetical protein ACFX15_043003 [Malus domestica]